MAEFQSLVNIVGCPALHIQSHQLLKWYISPVVKRVRTLIDAGHLNS